MSALDFEGQAEEALAATKRRPANLRRMSVTFLSPNPQPEHFPQFAYSHAGAVLSHCKFVAYVWAHDHNFAIAKVGQAFAVGQVESVEDGWDGMNHREVLGNVTQYRQRGLFRSLWAKVFG